MGSMKCLKWIMGWMMMAASSTAMADGMYLGTPSYGGTGCPAGTASVTLSPDQQTLSILFDQFTVEAGGMTGNRIDRKACNIAIPVHVPQGYSIAVFQADYRGFNALPRGGSSQFNVEYFFAGGRGPRYTKRFSGSLNQDFTISNTLAAEAMVWSPCGVDVNLRTNANMMVMTNNYGDQALSSVDSLDIQSGVVYHVQWKRCNGGGFGGGSRDRVGFSF